jgi:hypothetical protein
MNSPLSPVITILFTQPQIKNISEVERVLRPDQTAVDKTGGFDDHDEAPPHLV